MGKTKDDSASHSEFTEVNAPLIRKIIAERMLESKLTIPHFYLFDEIDMQRSVGLRGELNADGKYKISFNDFMVKAGALALQKHPECGVSYIDGKIRQYQNIHINIAVAVEGGLVVPTLKNCDNKSIYWGVL
jgi:pyruvate dehydrogenase E2 component (dihydrolipoamide acetyltransferase)